jgi:hypothetical protein
MTVLARDLARAFDPTLIAVDCGLTLDKWQAELMRSASRRVLLLCARQSGKSTVSALIGLSTALFEPSALVIIISPSQRQSAEMFRTLMNFYKALQDVPPLAAESVLRAEFGNGSRIVALPGNERTVRGYAAADLVVIDEAARVEDELLAAVRPMMATKSKARLIALSTPAGKRGWFFEAWTGGDDSWHRVRVPASECPRISQEFLAEELRELGAQRFSEEYGLEFLDPEESVFPSEIIARAFTSEVIPLWG